MEPETVEPRSGGVNLDFRIFLPWIMRWKVVVGGVTIIAVGYATFTGMRDKPIYGAEARVLMTSVEAQASDNPLAVLIGDQSGPLNMLRGVFDSHETRMMIAERAGLTEEDVKKKLIVLPDPQTKQLLLQARRESTATNLKLVTAAVDVLDLRSGALQFGPASRQAENIKKTLDSREAALSKAEDDLATYTKTMVSGPDASVVLTQWRELELQYGAAAKALEEAEKQVRYASDDLDIPSFLPGTEQLRNTIMERRLALATLRQSLGEGNPQVVKAKRDLQIAEDTLNAEVQKYYKSVDKNIDPVTMELAGKKAVLQWQVEEARKRANLAPEEAKTFGRLTREVGSLTALVNQLRGSYETIRIQADTERLTYTLLDRPFTRPDRENGVVEKIIKYLVAGFAGGLFVAWILDSLMKPRKRRA
jgi:uncharacterized protein involved in exopolysaccharide biosynthesis